jgi:KDO2-lipid IV(A) lauroyltransferase
VRRPTFKHRLEYILFRIFAGILRVLPERAAVILGEGLGWTAGVIFRIRMKDAHRHVALAFPNRSQKWRRRHARACFRHLGRESVAIMRMARLGMQEVIERTTMEGFQEFEEAIAEGRGGIIITGHLGNWEIGGASVSARGIPLDVVAQRQSNPLFDSDLNRTRNRLGMEVIERGDAPRGVLRSLRRGKVVALVADQNMRTGGIFVDFFGVPAATAKGPALFALRTGAPVFLGVALRLPGWRQRYRVVMERIQVEESGDLDRDVERLTVLHAARLQHYVEEYPGQYF